MTQRVFDIENEKDMQDLWEILPDDVVRIRKSTDTNRSNMPINNYDLEKLPSYYVTGILQINWHDKTEITRPIQEATFNDIGKLCRFWNDEEKNNFGILEEITSLNNELRFWKNNTSYKHCRRLTKQEIEELC